LECIRHGQGNSTTQITEACEKRLMSWLSSSWPFAEWLTFSLLCVTFDGRGKE
jgi:hypothetical protein